MFMKTKKIFILGATGQIGKELALELKNSSDIKFFVIQELRLVPVFLIIMK